MSCPTELPTHPACVRYLSCSDRTRQLAAFSPISSLQTSTTVGSRISLRWSSWRQALGAMDGIRKCFADMGGLNETDMIRVIADRQEQEFERLGLTFRTLGGRRLQLIDCQNLFCEVSKYARLKHPEIKGVSDRKRIKQIYRPAETAIEYWYPPKWGVNERILEASHDNERLIGEK